MQEPKPLNQTDNSDKNNKGEKDKLALSPEICSLWLEIRDEFQTLAELTEVVNEEPTDNV